MAKPNVISKSELLASAKQILAEKGLEKLTLKAVAEGANVTQGTVYYHFKTKEQLVLKIVEDLCSSSWENLEKESTAGAFYLQAALASAKSRCTSDSSYHHLFFQLVANGLHNENSKKQLGNMLDYENEMLAKQLQAVYKQSPVEGITFEHWGILLNALIDGLALQALLSPSFQADVVYEQLERLIHKLNKVK